MSKNPEPDPNELIGNLFSYPPECYECEDEIYEEGRYEYPVRYNSEIGNWELVCDRHDSGDYVVKVKYGKMEIAKGMVEECTKVVDVREK